MPATYPKNVMPNPEAVAMNNLVPGAEIVGYGMNIFGNYSFDAAIRPLFKLGTPQTWVAPSGQPYDLPSNVPTPGGSSSSASASSFATSSEFASYFQGSASVSGSVGAFSGSFSAAYSTSQQNSSDYTWAMIDADYVAWHVGINYSPEIVLDEVKNDPDWKNLPTTFKPNNEENLLAFYRFFQKFGTHFISNVVAGGTLYYYYAVSTAAGYSSTETEVSASAEFNGLICKTKEQANAQWGQCAANWTTSRLSHTVTVPAASDTVNWVNPPEGDYDKNNNFGQWKDNVLRYPSRCKFSLTPIWAVFSGTQWLALQEAYAAYASNRVSIEASRNGGASILVNGSPVVPDGGYPATHVPGWQLAVIDRKSLAVKLSKFYAIDFNQPNWPDPTCNAIAGDLQPFADAKKYMLVAATTAMDDACNPNDNLFSTLRGFGSGIFMDVWMSRPNHGCSSGPGSAVYGLVGAGAVVSGCEGFGDNYPSPAMPATTVSINALLLPTGNTFTPTPYTP
jgi:hypothetical protein